MSVFFGGFGVGAAETSAAATGFLGWGFGSGTRGDARAGVGCQVVLVAASAYVRTGGGSVLVDTRSALRPICAGVHGSFGGVFRLLASSPFSSNKQAPPSNFQPHPPNLPVLDPTLSHPLSSMLTPCHMLLSFFPFLPRLIPLLSCSLSVGDAVCGSSLGCRGWSGGGVGYWC